MKPHLSRLLIASSLLSVYLLPPSRYFVVVVKWDITPISRVRICTLQSAIMFLVKAFTIDSQLGSLLHKAGSGHFHLHINFHSHRFISFNLNYSVYLFHHRDTLRTYEERTTFRMRPILTYIPHLRLTKPFIGQVSIRQFALMAIRAVSISGRDSNLT